MVWVLHIGPSMRSMLASLTPLVLLPLVLLFVAGCGSSSQPSPDTCTSAKECAAGEVCRDGACEALGSDAGAPLPWEDAGGGTEPVDGGSVPGEDAGANAPQDAGPPAMVAPPVGFTFAAPATLYDAVVLDDGVLAVGRSDRPPGSMRRYGLIAHYGADQAVRWATLLDDGRNAQFFGAAAADGIAMAGGLTKGFSVAATQNDDILLARVDASGVQQLWSWGTDRDELLFELAPGGSVAPFIGVGYHEPNREEASRNALVVAFEADGSPRWAVAFDSGALDELYSVATLDDRILAVGRTVAPDGTSDGLILSLSASGELLWARRFGAPQSSDHLAFAGTQGGRWVVAGNYNRGDGDVLGAVLQLEVSGATAGGVGLTSGVWMRVNGMAFTSGGAILHGEFSPQRSWIARAEGPAFQTRALRVFDRLQTRGLTQSPLLLDAAPPRLVTESSGTFVDLPIALDGRVGCETTRVVPIVGPLDAQPTEVSLTRTALGLVGGAVPGFREALSTEPMRKDPVTCE